MTTGNSIENGTRPRPDYADFDDQRFTQQTVVAVRWFLLASWLGINHYRTTFSQTLVMVDLIGLGIIMLNAWLQIRLIQGRPVSKRIAIGLSVADIVAISAGIAITNRFDNTFFVIYYPALFVLALVLSSSRLSVIAVSLTATAYASISLLMSPGVDTSLAHERTLAIRIAIMFAIVLAGNLIMKTERARRMEAVEAERSEALENMRLQKVAQATELKAAEDRLRIRREIHDGIAQSLYALNLNLESCAIAAKDVDAELSARLDTLVPIAKQALLEARHYMHDLKPMLLEGGDLVESIQNLSSEFESVAGISVDVQISGDELNVPVECSAQLVRILQEALSNVLKHARATDVTIKMIYGTQEVSISVTDNGQGFELEAARAGLGLGNITSRTRELGGTVAIESKLGRGTSVHVAIPIGEGSNA